MKNNSYLTGKLFKKLKNIEIAIGHFEDAANTGHLESMYELGKINNPSSVIKSWEWYTMAADKGHMESQYEAGSFNYLGVGIGDQDIDQGRKYFEMAAKQGHFMAQFRLGISYSDDHPKDKNKAYKWLTKTANRDHIESQMRLGRMYKNDKCYHKSIEWFTTAGIQGNDDAYCAIGSFYAIDMSDYAKSLNWFLKAANMDNKEAQYTLGDMYYNGKGVKEDRKLSFEWYKKSADNHYVDAIFKISTMYFKGIGVEGNYDEAMKGFTRALNQYEYEDMKYLKDPKNKKIMKLKFNFYNGSTKMVRILSGMKYIISYSKLYWKLILFITTMIASVMALGSVIYYLLTRLIN